MNCRRVEKLIPLYVEGDLASGMADRITSHLEWCGGCNLLADEYKESQSWLRSSQPPEFDEAFLNGLKAGVLRRIEETSARPSLLTSLVQQWSLRQVLSLSTAMLIIFGVVVFYIYQARMNLKPRVVEAVKTPDRQSPPSNELRQTPDTGTAPGAGLSNRYHARNQANIKARSGAPIVPKHEFEAQVSQTDRMEQSGIGAAEPTDAFAGGGFDLPAMLRIEIYTSDPNIRIIWFAPREVERPQTNQ